MYSCVHSKCRAVAWKYSYLQIHIVINIRISRIWRSVCLNLFFFSFVFFTSWVWKLKKVHQDTDLSLTWLHSHSGPPSAHKQQSVVNTLCYLQTTQILILKSTGTRKTQATFPIFSLFWRLLAFLKRAEEEENGGGENERKRRSSSPLTALHEEMQ